MNNLTMKHRKPGQYRIKVLEKALDILDLFDNKSEELSAAEINQRLGLNKTTTFRILRILEESDYLERAPESLKFRLGFKLYRLGSLVEGNVEIQKLAHPFLEDLKDKCDETVHLVVLHSGEALYLDKIEGKKAIRVVSRVGMKLPAHCSGVGKVLLASLPEANVEKILRKRGLKRFTRNTISDLETLKKELARVRVQGYAIDNEEIEVGLKCVAAPIMDSRGEVIAAISISGPRDRFLESDIARLLPMVLNTSEQISNCLIQKQLTSDALRNAYA